MDKDSAPVTETRDTFIFIYKEYAPDGGEAPYVTFSSLQRNMLSDVQSGCTLLLIEREHAPFIWKTYTLLGIAKADASFPLKRQTLSSSLRRSLPTCREERHSSICIECVCFLYTERRHHLSSWSRSHSSRKKRNNLLAIESIHHLYMKKKHSFDMKRRKRNSSRYIYIYDAT